MSRFCEECGEPVRENENFCSNCGAKIIRDESPSPSTVKLTSTSESTSTATSTSSTQQRVAEFYAKKKAAVQSPSPSTVKPTSTSESTSTDAQSSDTAKRVAEFYAKKKAAVQSPSPSTVQETSTTSSSKDDDKPTDRLLVKIIGGFLVFTILLAMAASSSKITSHSSNEPTQTEETSVKSQSAPLTEADFELAGLTLGMSKADVEKKLGKPTNGSEDFFNYLNVEVGFENGVVKSVACTNANATPRKIGIGDYLSSIEEAYGKDYSHDQDESGDIYTYTLDESALRFVLDKRKGNITRIVIYKTTSQPEPATVPDLVGKTQSDAVAALKAAGLEVKSSDSYSDSVPTGKIISQTPNPGAKIEKGQTVYVYVSKGVDPAKSPAPLTEADLAIGGLTLGMSRQAVEQKLGAPKSEGRNFIDYNNFSVKYENNAATWFTCTGGEAKTPRGIHVGSTLAEVENAYGKNYFTEPRHDGTLYSYRLENAHLNFVINAAGRVDTIAFYIIYAYAPSAETPKPSPPPAPKPASDGYNYSCTVNGTTTYKGIKRNGIACALYDWQTQKQMSFEYLGTYTARGTFYIVTAIVGNGTNAPIMTPTLYLVDERGRKYSSNDTVTSAYDANRNIEIELMLNPGQPQYAYEVFDIPDGVNITGLRCEAFTADFDAVEFNLPFRVITE